MAIENREIKSSVFADLFGDDELVLALGEN